jgi:hypothetical protein
MTYNDLQTQGRRLSKISLTGPPERVEFTAAPEVSRQTSLGHDGAMRLEFCNVDTLPRLAWCARILLGQEAVTVLHGPWVETGADFFVEGAWSGDFTRPDFDLGTLMGSGGRVLGEELVFAAPNYTLEQIFVLRNRDALWVSNSFAFVLACTDDSVHPRALLYSVKLETITDGLKAYTRYLPTRNGYRVRMYYHCNLLVDRHLRIREQPKAPVREFVDFDDYKGYLLEKVAAIQENASHPRRKITFRPIATISTGYDSPAGAVLARAVGCNEALTFAQARRDAHLTPDEVADSGAEIGSALGMKVHVFDRLDYLKEKGFPEAEFYGNGAQEAPWASHLEGKVLFTGFHGDKVWDKHCPKVSRDIVRGDSSGTFLNAFRLRVGWIHLPVPFLGCTSLPSIHKISNSREMQPWSLGNDYDRPIPRRLVEEAGVQRRQFGIKKKAACVGLVAEGFQGMMTKESFDDYLMYYSAHWGAWMGLKQKASLFLRWLCFKNEGFNRRVSAFAKNRLSKQVNLPVLIPRSIRMKSGDLDMLALLVPWSIEKILPCYEVDKTESREYNRHG